RVGGAPRRGRRAAERARGRLDCSQQLLRLVPSCEIGRDGVKRPRGEQQDDDMRRAGPAEMIVPEIY
ncbi:hypothetical protein OIV52_31720, partial [Burkholderia pseudomallei]|nr:hypothetical protein [Burkholderia pseudomallei]